MTRSGGVPPRSQRATDAHAGRGGGGDCVAAGVGAGSGPGAWSSPCEGHRTQDVEGDWICEMAARHIVDAAGPRMI